MTKNFSMGALAVGLVGICLGVPGIHGDSLTIAGAILVSAGIIATAIIEGRKPN